MAGAGAWYAGWAGSLLVCLCLSWSAQRPAWRRGDPVRDPAVAVPAIAVRAMPPISPISLLSVFPSVLGQTGHRATSIVEGGDDLVGRDAPAGDHVGVCRRRAETNGPAQVFS